MAQDSDKQDCTLQEATRQDSLKRGAAKSDATEPAPLLAVKDHIDDIPKYKCSEVVRALKIKSIQHLRAKDNSVVLTFEDEKFEEHVVASQIAHRWGPQPGGYYIIHADGSESFCDENKFEENFSKG